MYHVKKTVITPIVFVRKISDKQCLICLMSNNVIRMLNILFEYFHSWPRIIKLQWGCFGRILVLEHHPRKSHLNLTNSVLSDTAVRDGQNYALWSSGLWNHSATICLCASSVQEQMIRETGLRGCLTLWPCRYPPNPHRRLDDHQNHWTIDHRPSTVFIHTPYRDCLLESKSVWWRIIETER